MRFHSVHTRVNWFDAKSFTFIYCFYFACVGLLSCGTCSYSNYTVAILLCANDFGYKMLFAATVQQNNISFAYIAYSRSPWRCDAMCDITIYVHNLICRFRTLSNSHRIWNVIISVCIYKIMYFISFTLYRSQHDWDQTASIIVIIFFSVSYLYKLNGAQTGATRNNITKFYACYSVWHV